MTEEEKRYTCKELAGILRRSVSFIYAMRRRGFTMPGGVSTLSRAEVWLVRNPNPRGKERNRHTADNRAH
jgi:hypothetical protein